MTFGYSPLLSMHASYPFFKPLNAPDYLLPISLSKFIVNSLFYTIINHSIILREEVV
jgi:hypothetical protein